jgi:outer membrane protein OmpA-like peptidoglycan-associated protein
VAYLVKAPRVGRSQGAVIFWGLVSAFFASAFCYYYLKNRTNEESARQAIEQMTTLQDQKDVLSSERDKIEAVNSDAQKQLQARGDFLQDKETKLAEEEAEIDAMGNGDRAAQSQAQADAIKRFDDIARKLSAGATGADVTTRGGRPVLRMPSSSFFAAGHAHLLPGGRNILDQAARAIGGQGARFEMRVDTFSDSGGESAKNATSAPGPAGDATGVPDANDADAKTHYATAWDLTAARAEAIEHYLHDQETLPFQDVLAVGRGDSSAGDGGSGDHAHNRLVTITLAPIAAPFHAPESTKGSHAKASATPPLAPPPDATQGAP